MKSNEIMLKNANKNDEKIWQFFSNANRVLEDLCLKNVVFSISEEEIFTKSLDIVRLDYLQYNFVILWEIDRIPCRLYAYVAAGSRKRMRNADFDCRLRFSESKIRPKCILQIPNWRFRAPDCSCKYRVDPIFWPDINNQIPDTVCALVKTLLG